MRKVLYSSLLLLFYTYIYIIDSRGRNGGGVQKMYPLYILYYTAVYTHIYIYDTTASNNYIYTRVIY